jgi:hypothetical protein
MISILRDNSLGAFITNDSPTGIARQFLEFVTERPVSRLVVISPYWDEKLAALKYLSAELSPEETILLIEPKKRLFPSDALNDLSELKLTDISALDPMRFFHAKAIIAQTAEADHVLFGSANCTTAALGTSSSRGINDEACLYRRLPPHTVIQFLGIDKFVTDEHAIERSTLRPPELEDDLDLSELSRRYPGRFESVYDTLIWWPPANAGDNTIIEPLDADSNLLPLTLTPIHGERPTRRFRLPNTKERPALARLRYQDGGMSAPAIIILVDALKQSAKEARSRKVDAAVALLSEETIEDVSLLEVIDILEAAEEREAEEAKTITRASDASSTRPNRHRNSTAHWTMKALSGADI